MESGDVSYMKACQDGKKNRGSCKETRLFRETNTAVDEGNAEWKQTGEKNQTVTGKTLQCWTGVTVKALNICILFHFILLLAFFKLDHQKIQCNQNQNCLFMFTACIEVNEWGYSQYTE